MEENDAELHAMQQRSAAAFRAAMGNRTAFERSRPKSASATPVDTTKPSIARSASPVGDDARSQRSPTPPRSTGRRTIAFLAAVIAVIYFGVTQCGTDDNAAPAVPDDGLLDCDEPSVELLDVQWEPHPLETGPPLWDLMSASVRITNNTRHKIAVTGAAVVAVRYDRFGIRQPVDGYLDERPIPYGFGSTPSADWVDGFDSIEYSENAINWQLGKPGEIPPTAEVYPLWEFANDDMNSGCRTQRLEGRTS